MKLILSHQTALDVLCSYRVRGGGAPVPAQIDSLDDCVASRKRVLQFALPPFMPTTNKLHVLVPRVGLARHSNDIVCHVWQANLVPGAFWLVGEDVYAATPELLFVQMAKELPSVDLMLLGMELCGRYTLHPSGTGAAICQPVTTRERLASFAAQVPETRGAAIARHVLRYVADGASGPDEAALALYLSLPPHQGGYGLPLSLPVQPVPRETIADPQAFEAHVRTLARKAGKRLYPAAYEATPQRNALRATLFPWLEG